MKRLILPVTVAMVLMAFFERGNRSELDKLIKFFENGVPAVVR